MALEEDEITPTLGCQTERPGKSSRPGRGGGGGIEGKKENPTEKLQALAVMERPTPALRSGRVQVELQAIIGGLPVGPKNAGLL